MRHTCPWQADRFSMWAMVNFDALTVAATLASAAVSAAGAISSGQAQARAANFQAAVMRQQAERERQLAARKEEDYRREQSRLFAARRAAGGASGIDLSVGSPLLVSEDFAGEREYQALTIRAGGEDAATRLEQSAALQRLQGRTKRNEGFTRGGALLLSGVAEAAKIR